MPTQRREIGGAAGSQSLDDSYYVCFKAGLRCKRGGDEEGVKEKEDYYN